ncbi:16S rRNA (guanine(527)-N(7))-methyltransferase RsmG [Roseivivax sp. CAU 1753]
MIDLGEEWDVSRETLVDLSRFVALVELWSAKINLISRQSLADIANRHIADSLQLKQFTPAGKSQWLDLGSGGGFPGIVAAIFAKRHNPDLTFTLVESDGRKAVFLRTAIREFGLNAKVLTQRIEKLGPQKVDIVSARALADLTQLLAYAKPHMAPTSRALFLKGATWKKELEAARREWSFEYEVVKSTTDPNAVILSIGNIANV